MKTNPEALKDLYIALGGEEAVVADKAQTVDVLNALAAKYDGKADATLIPDAIDNITAVADNIGGVKPSGTIDLETNGLHDVTNYASANVNVPASAVVSGTKDITLNGIQDVTNYARVNVNVAADIKYGSVIIKNNSSGTITFYEDTAETDTAERYSYGYKKIYIASGESKTVGVQITEDTVNTKWKVDSLNRILTANVSNVISASVTPTTANVTLVNVTGLTYALRVTDSWTTLSGTKGKITVTIADAS